MVFSSLLFLFRFFPAVLVLYFIAPKKWRNAVLFFCSLVFYAWGEPIYVILMLFSTVVDYVHGRFVQRFKDRGQMGKAKLAVASSMVINLGLLGFFKYTDFLLENINQLFGTSIPLTELALPIGISFYTFQTMSYTIDIYRGDAVLQRNILSFGTYVALFPQLIAGPIVQYKTIAEQLTARKITLEGFTLGVRRFLTGLGKKVLLANNIGLLWDQVLAMQLAGTKLPALTAWLGITAFAFQIYFDFSGYSDMAIGLGMMFGFRFLENFNYPYMSKSITEFWRRWHISLGSWFRDYVYIPLGGNRCVPWKRVRNILIVWLLTGFWHGASWNFLVWGVYYGLLLLIEKNLTGKWLEKLPTFMKCIYSLLLTWIGWVIFAFDDLGEGWVFLKTLFGGSGIFADLQTGYLFCNFGIVLLILIISCTDYPKRFAAKYILTRPSWYMTILHCAFVSGVFLLSLAYLVDASYNPFLYFRF